MIRALGRAWVEPDGAGGWRRRRGRAVGGALTETQAAVRMLEVVHDHDAEQSRLEADAEERRRRGVTFRELGGEWLEYLEHEKGVKPSTLRDYRWLLAEPGQVHRRGSGRSPGLLLRLGELLALRWADVNLSDRRLVVHRAFSDRIDGPTKGWQARFLPIANPAAKAFARLAARGEFVGADDFVFCSRFGRPLDGSALRRRFKRAAAAAGLRVLRFHALRHGAGSMVAQQADPRWVQGFLGHSRLTTTERYLHAKARPQDVDLLNRAFAAASHLPAGTLTDWDRVVNEHPLPNTDPNRSVLVGPDGSPASRDELIEFARENDAHRASAPVGDRRPARARPAAANR